MIPIIWILIAWAIIMVIYLLMTLLTVNTMMRFGVARPGTYLSTAIFLGVIAIVLILVGAFLISMDWSQSIDVLPSFGSAISF